MTTARYDLLRWTDRCQARATLSTEHVSDLVAAYLAGDAVPPLDVVERKDGTMLVVDGYHRGAALMAIVADDPKHRSLEAVAIRIVTKGDDDRAAWLALGANAEHGLARTRADKRRAVTLALAHPYAADLTQRELAEQCRVSAALVAEVRAEERGAPSPKAESTARTAEAVAANPTASVRDIAAKAGTSKSSAARAKAKAGVPVTPNSQPGHPKKPAETGARENGPPPALVAGYERLGAAVRKARSEDTGDLSHADRQDVDGMWKRLAWIAEHGRPVACPDHSEDCRTCAGRGWIRQADLKAGKR